MRDDQGHRVWVARLDLNEVDVHAVDLGRELRERVQLRLAFTPVVLGSPVTRELLKFSELRTLRLISHGLLVRPSRCRDAALHIGKRLVWKVRAETPNCVGFC